MQANKVGFIAAAVVGIATAWVLSAEFTPEPAPPKPDPLMQPAEKAKDVPASKPAEPQGPTTVTFDSTVACAKVGERVFQCTAKIAPENCTKLVIE